MEIDRGDEFRLPRNMIIYIRVFARCVWEGEETQFYQKLDIWVGIQNNTMRFSTPKSLAGLGRTGCILHVAVNSMIEPYDRVNACAKRYD